MMNDLSLKLRFFFLFIILVGMPLAILLSQQNQDNRQHAATSIQLPGEQTWNNGVSSLLFGTNNTDIYATDNIETDTGIQQTMAKGHVSLIRTWFFDCATADSNNCTLPDGVRYDSDQEIERRLKTDENIGAKCLGVLPDMNNLTFDSHVISYAGNRCLMYEFGNEPDLGKGMVNYIQQWNTMIPQLRKVNPNVKFIGPVVSNYSNVQTFLNGVKTSGVLPDAISFHDYPCWQQNAASCLATAATSFTNQINHVRTQVVATLGQNLPIGITEWNADPGDNQLHSLMSNQSFVQQFTTSALNQMIQAKLDFANQFSAAGYDGYGDLDMFDTQNHGQPKLQWVPFANMIAQSYPGSANPPSISLPQGISSTPIPHISLGQPIFSIALCLHGLGNCGDNANPSGGGNMNPQHPQRNVTINLINGQNQVINTTQGTITYNTTVRNFQGSIALGTVPNGNYLVNVKVNGFLHKQFPGIVAVTNKQMSLATLPLTTGDINNDNQLDIVDYNLLISCYGSKANTSSCSNKTASDITDDGQIDGADYNLFLREISVQPGDTGGPSVTPAPPLTPNPTITPVAHFSLLPLGTTLPSDAQCAAEVRRMPENRPDNIAKNNVNEYNNGATNTGSRTYIQTVAPTIAERITGNFTGTTDEILQWGACKWGFDEDDVRAEAEQESYWHQSQLGDSAAQTQPGLNGHPSVGILQVKGGDIPPTHPGTWPYAYDSTSWNVDYTLAIRRACFEGKETWLGNGYKAGDLWGCIGRWYSGAWHNAGAESYIASVKQYLANKDWLKPGF